jgi:uncharacterized membrane protein
LQQRRGHGAGAATVVRARGFFHLCRRVNVPGVVGMGMTIAVMVPVCIAAFGMGMAHRKNPR